MKKALACLIVAIAAAGLGGLSAVRAPILEQGTGLELSRAVGTGPNTMILSNVNNAGSALVARLVVAPGPSLEVVPGSVTVSEPPTISNLTATPSCNPVICPEPQLPQLIELRFDFEDLNGDIMAGHLNLDYLLYAGSIFIGGIETYIFFPPKPNISVVWDTQTTGHVIMDTCWGGFDDGDFDIGIVDGAENPSNQLGVSVGFPTCTETASNFVGRMPRSERLRGLLR